MSPRRWPARAAALAPAAALAAMLAGGCVSFNDKQPAVQVYNLTPTPAAPAAPAPSGAATLVVLRPLAAPGLDTSSIALARDGQRLDYYAASRWPVPLPELMQSLAVEALRASGKYRSVQPDGSAFAADLVLQIELRRCQAVYSGDGPPVVQVQLLATLGRRGERNVLATASAESSVPAADNRMQPVVAAFQSAVGAALADLASRLGT